MHRYRTVAQISLTLFIINLVLAAPIVVQEIHEARGDEIVVAEGVSVAAMAKKWRELEAASVRSTSPRSPLDAMASAQHSSSSDGSTSPGYPAPHLSSDSSHSGYSWLLERPPRLRPNLPASLHESASPRPSSSGPPEIPLVQGLAPEVPPSPPHPSSSGSSELSVAPSPQLTESDLATAETYSPSDRFTPSHRPSSLSTDNLSWRYRNPWFSDESMSTLYSSASGGSLSSYYLSASDGLVPSLESISGGSVSSHHPMPEGFVPSHHSMPEGFAQSLTPDGSPPSPSSPPTETPSDNAESFNKNMIKKIGIVAGVVIVGGTIASIVGSRIEHHKSQDS
jgi:hypothetical protein